jgi:polyisoprenyl-phosphate glycosyltransferase
MHSKQIPLIGIIIPCFNEEAVFNSTLQHVSELVNELIQDKLIATSSSITFIDDGSIDSTWQLIIEASKENKNVHGIKLSRNCGHQNALMAGLMIVDGDALVSIDADLQDDLNAIKEMVLQFTNGNEIVYGVRSSRLEDSFFKRFSAEVFYKILFKLGVDITFNHADFRLLGRRPLNALKEFSEVNLFIRGMIPKLGFKYTNVYYVRKCRLAGESKYSFTKMFGLAWDGLTSFSPFPLKMIVFLGFLISTISFFLGTWFLIFSIWYGGTVAGWASTIIPIYFLGGIQLLCIGVIGEYISKIFTEVKRRPRYIIEEKV